MPLSATVVQFQQGENCIEAMGSRPFVFGTVDPYHNELLFSVPKLLTTPPKGYLPDYPNTIYPFDIWDGQAKTMVYKLGDGDNIPHWQGAYTFATEYFVTLQNNLYSFKYGNLYLHNDTSSYNEFYGIQYKSKIMFLSNAMPSRVKVYNNIAIEGNLTPSLTYFLNEIPYLQTSDLSDFNYRDLEGFLYAPLFRNKIQPTATGYTTTSLLTGEKMRSYAMRVMLQFNVTTTPLELRFVTIGFDDSRGQKT